MTLHSLVFLSLGLILLVVGAEWLVRGASRLALRFGISPLVIGLTVVAFGTSAPELAVSVQAGLNAQAGLAMGNVVGSNIFNVLAVLGVSAMIAPLVVQQQLIRLDAPLVLAVSILVWVMALDGRIGLFDGLLLTAGIVAYTIFAIRQSRLEQVTVENEYTEALAAQKNAWLDRLPAQIALIIAGLVLLVLGAQWMVDSAVSIARALGVNEVIIGLTIVAAGTSLPELATSVVAAFRGEGDIAVGNVVGSGLFNLLGILGIAALVTPGGLEVAASLLQVDMLVMIAVALACLPIFANGLQITRLEGTALFGFYLAYLAHLVFVATEHPALPVYRSVMLGFVLPLTVATLTVLMLRRYLLDKKARNG